jgi:glucose/arabinose dehydrogenase
VSSGAEVLGVRILWLALAVAVAAVGGAVLLLLSCVTVNVPLLRPSATLPLGELRGRLELPAGFEVDYFAQGLQGPRLLRFSSAGDLLVSSPSSGSLLLLEPDRDGDGRSDGVRTLLGELNTPHGLDVHEGWLYVAEGGAVRRVRFDAATGTVSGALETVVPELPAGGNHWTRTLRFGPDGKLYVSVGSSCNVCQEEDERRAALLRYNADGSGYQRFASGLRNSVGFDFHPSSGEIYATDNGRDLLGDDIPPCELNRVLEGGFYGWPYAYGERVPDPTWGKGREAEIAQSVPPEHAFGAHTAPLGIAFYRGSAFPEPYRSSAYVAQHGSWNRTRKSGYRVVRLEWDASGAIQESDFAVGFERDEDVIGRPVDVISGPDGALYVSDDYGGSIYRVRYVGASAG